MGGSMFGMRPESDVIGIGGGSERDYSPEYMMGTPENVNAQSPWSMDSIFGNNGMANMGAGFGIAKDLFGMYQANKGMKAGITGMNNRTKTGNYNMANKTNFINGTAGAFGNQATAQNQFGSMV